MSDHFQCILSLVSSVSASVSVTLPAPYISPPLVSTAMTMTKSTQDLQIAILGAGMGGLTCALALARRGFKTIDVYENAHDLGFVGAGIQLAPNMARVLDGLGVWKPIEAEAVNIMDTSVRGT